MLDDRNVLKQRDPEGSLEFIANLYQSLDWQPEVLAPEHDNRKITNIVVAGMGGSALAAELIRVVARQDLDVPFEIIKGYSLPKYVDEHTLVIAVSHSGNTEETLECYARARLCGSQVAVVTSGGKLAEIAGQDNVVHIIVPAGAQPRMSIFHHLLAELSLLEHFGIVGRKYRSELAEARDWLRDESVNWHQEVPVQDNLAKQIALVAAGKTPVIYGGEITAPFAYKWKISWNENAKNIAFCNQYPEASHNEFIGWSSHPVDKPYVIFDLRSRLERPRLWERMELTDRLLSGMRPKAYAIELAGENYWQQAIWACTLADAASCYAAVLNGVNPTPVELVEKFKQALS